MPSAPTDRPEDGFTLLEVVIALAMLGIVSAAALAMAVTGLKDSATLSQRQTAVTVASQALETARSVTAARGATGVSGLVAGRTASAVQAQWAAVSVPDGSMALTWPASDPTLPTPAVSVPLTSTSVLAGQTFTVNTLIGTCYRLRRPTTSAPCTKDPSGTGAGSEPVSDASVVSAMRVIAVVTWKPPSRSSCGADACTYTASELIDPATDLVWNPAGDLVAVDDNLSVAAGSTTSINVLHNDQGAFSPTNPVSVVTNPSAGSVTVGSDGVLTYTAPTTGGQSVSLQYTATGTSGAVSNPATVTITVTP